MLAKVIEVDLQQSLAPIYMDSRYSAAVILVRWGYFPIGKLRLQCIPDQRTISAKQLESEIFRAFGWQLWEYYSCGKFIQSEETRMRSLPPISVIVCTRDRVCSLANCLGALRQLDYPLYEVIVVDNCSEDAAIAQVVAENGFRYVREDNPGLDRARNCGIREAHYDLIAFIDDDALATTGWLRGIARGFADSEIMAVTGMVLPAELETPAQDDFETYGGMSKGFNPFTIRRSELSNRALFWTSGWGVGANMAFRRSLFQAVGTFDVALDVGTPTNGGGDIEFFYRTVAAGYALRYEPAAFVYHTHRRAATALNQQIYNNGRSFGAYLLTIVRNDPQKRAEVLWFALRWWIWSWLIYRLVRSILTRDAWTRDLAFIELRGALSSVSTHRAAQRLATQLLNAEKDAYARIR